MPLSQRSVLDVSADLPFSLWAVPAEIRGLGYWMEARGTSFFPSGCFHSSWMSVILGNVAHEQRRKPPTSSRAPESICLWQTTHEGSRARGSVSASNKKGEGVILSAGIMKLLVPSVLLLISIWKERSMTSDAAGNLSAYALLCMIYCSTLIYTVNKVMKEDICSCVKHYYSHAAPEQWRIMIKQCLQV